MYSILNPWTCEVIESEKYYYGVLFNMSEKFLDNFEYLTDKVLNMLSKNARVMYDNVCGAIDMYYDSLEYNC